MTNNDLTLKLAFLGVCTVIIICLAVLIGCGHDGTLIDTFMGISGVMFGANGLQIWASLKK